MRKLILISDSFKGTISSREIVALARQSFAKLAPDCELIALPVADGGEGTVACFVEAIGAEIVTVTVQDPYGCPREAIYARKGSQAIIEMAEAAGLPLVGERKNPEETSTYGVGQLIAHALDSACTELILGLGGSATNDGGCGCAAALGARFYDQRGLSFIPRGKNLEQIERIDLSACKAKLGQAKVTVMCDVSNPLIGPNGAAAVYAPQKGADAEMVQRLDRNLAALARVVERDLALSIADIPGSGAAGGMGGGCIAFLNGKLRSGIDVVLETINFEQLLEGVDYVITGEGRLDGQSLQGKVLSGVAKHTMKRLIPLIALVGGVSEDAIAVHEQGVCCVFTTNREARELGSNSEIHRHNYQASLEEVIRLILTVEQQRDLRMSN